MSFFILCIFLERCYAKNTAFWTIEHCCKQTWVGHQISSLVGNGVGGCAIISAMVFGLVKDGVNLKVWGRFILLWCRMDLFQGPSHNKKKQRDGYFHLSFSEVSAIANEQNKLKFTNPLFYLLFIESNSALSVSLTQPNQNKVFRA